MIIYRRFSCTHCCEICFFSSCPILLEFHDSSQILMFYWCDIQLHYEVLRHFAMIFIQVIQNIIQRKGIFGIYLVRYTKYDTVKGNKFDKWKFLPYKDVLTHKQLYSSHAS